jgi:hypothetical protein
MTAPLPPYQPFYCEENAYLRVAGDARPGGDCALFVTNARRQVAVFEQRLAPPGEPVLWDYHVVAVSRATHTVVDPDSRLEVPCELERYLAAAFPPLPPRLAAYAPRFRLVSAAELVATFASDRRHMRVEGGAYREPPPPWPPIGEGHTLDRYLDLADPIAGEVLSLDGLRRALLGDRSEPLGS